MYVCVCVCVFEREDMCVVCQGWCEDECMREERGWRYNVRSMALTLCLAKDRLVDLSTSPVSTNANGWDFWESVGVCEGVCEGAGAG